MPRVQSQMPEFQSTPSVWRETGYLLSDRLAAERISIHSLRVEGDTAIYLPLSLR